jgi:acyl-CoA thioester hydrolase
MEKYFKQVQIRWADLDQNGHIRHSAYYDYGAMIRIEFLTGHGLSTAKMVELNVGPVLFREEAIFRREIKQHDKLTIDLEMTKGTTDFSKWSIRHNFLKADGTLMAVLNTDGAWIDTNKRKLISKNTFIQKAFEAMPKSSDFELIVRSSSVTTG